MATAPSFTLEQVLHDARAHKFFLDYLQRKQAETLLLFWSDCEQFKQLMGNTMEIEAEARKIRDIHFTGRARTAQLLGAVETKRLLNRTLCLDTFTSAQRECARLLKTNYFPGFVQSKSFTDLVNELRELKYWTLFDAFRDARRVKALHLLMQVERPDFLDTLKFALDLRNLYKPLVAEALAPTKSSSKLHVIKQLMDTAKLVEKKYLNSMDKQHFARGVSGTSMARTKMSLDELSHKLDALMAVSSLQGASSSSAQSGGGSSAATTTPSRPKSSATHRDTHHHHPVTAEELIRMMADVFKQVEEEALAWLERVAMVDARKTDYFLTPICEPGEDLEFEQDAILVFTCSPSEHAFRLAGPHVLQQQQRSIAQTTHYVKMDTVFVGNKEDASQYASDSTGATVSTNTRGMKFRTKLVSKTTFPHVKPMVRVEEEPLGSSKVTSLAGVSQLESIAENNARTRSAHQFNSGSGLENTELHAYCFPLALAVDVELEGSTTTSASLGNELVYYHAFVCPCRTSKHSFEHNCQCLFGVCKTRVRTKPLTISRHEHDLNHSSLLSDVTSSGIGNSSFSFKRSLLQAGASGNVSSTATVRKTYSECALWLDKVPNFGLGLNLALNRDGSVVVTRFVSDLNTPSPAATSGKIQVEDELLQVNNVPTYGRKFDDIVAQIKASSSPVYLRFSRGNYLDSIFTGTLVPARNASSDLPSSGSGNTTAATVEESQNLPLIDQQTFSIYSPETECMLSNAPVFAEMRAAMERGETQLPANTPVLPIDAASALFSHLSVPVVVDLLSSLLLERRVVVCSEFPDRLAPAVTCLLQLIRPFSWQFEFAPLLPDSHWDWIATRTSASADRPSLVGLCCVDVCPQPAANYIAPRRHGRLTLREDDWSARERDYETPVQRLSTGGGGNVRGVVQQYFTAKDTVAVDLDADYIALASASDCFPEAVRSHLLAAFNSALGRGGLSTKHDAQTSTEMIHQAMAEAYRMLALDRVIDFTLSLKEGGVIGFYRQAFLRSCAPKDTTRAFLERFTKTETFREFTISEWNLRKN